MENQEFNLRNYLYNNPLLEKKDTKKEMKKNKNMKKVLLKMIETILML